MTTESNFIDLMRAIATDPAARGLADDAAVIEFGKESLILTHDMMVEGVHWLPNADPADVAWKLVASNLSDLAAKGAEPLGMLLGFMLGADEWDRRFADGLAQAHAKFAVPLLGGDTTGQSGAGGARAIGMTALGRATYRPVPDRRGAKAGDFLFVTGTLGDAAAGYDVCRNGQEGPAILRDAFNRPHPQLAAGRALAAVVHAMMDISDGLLIDARRMAKASGIMVKIELDALPLSTAYCAFRGDSLASRLAAASWGDDYQLLFAAPSAALPVPATCVGRLCSGNGLSLQFAGEPVPLPSSLGFEHR